LFVGLACIFIFYFCYLAEIFSLKKATQLFCS
jgi:hypothetical protein